MLPVRSGASLMLDMLFVHWHVDPVLFHIWGLPVRWYGLLFAMGFVLGPYLFRWFFKTEKVDLRLLDPLFYCVFIATIVGARLGHCIFYQPDYYFGSWSGFLEIFMPWKGGLASHGGAIALLIAIWWYTARYGRKADMDFLWVIDRLCIAVAFAGCMIRLGNLFNSEIYGDRTSMPWGFIFELRGETVPKHPTQLYEALCYLLLGLIMVVIYKYRPNSVYRGFYFGFFLLGCFGSRFLIEFIKEPQVQFEESMMLDMGQWLSVPFIIAGVAFLVLSYKWKKPSMLVRPAAAKPAGPVARPKK